MIAMSMLESVTKFPPLSLSLSELDLIALRGADEPPEVREPAAAPVARLLQGCTRDGTIPSQSQSRLRRPPASRGCVRARLRPPGIYRYPMEARYATLVNAEGRS